FEKKKSSYLILSNSHKEQLSCCALCQEALRDPVSTSCGHWFCRQCITSDWEQSGSSGDSACPQCGERSRTRPGLQTLNQTRPVDGGLIYTELYITQGRREGVFLHWGSFFTAKVKYRQS
uniref:RING-type domain-containing protein n=1 Tax=Myripristis murdjan TaxID=586833 RepID=A0A667Z5Z9_9TELE